MMAGIWPELRSFFAPARRLSERVDAFNGTDFIFLKFPPAWLPGQLVRPPLNSNSEVTDELLWIRLIASPKSPATDNVTTFTPLIAGRRTVSVVTNSSIGDFRNLSIPMEFRIAWETQARIRLAPLRLISSAAIVSVPAVSVKSSTSNTSLPRISPITAMDSTSVALLRRLATIARPPPNTCEYAYAIFNPPMSGLTTTRSRKRFFFKYSYITGAAYR